jgi:DNA-directed RNA polymerase specialized sigma24 family protein
VNDALVPALGNDPVDIVALDDLLERLAELNVRHARVVELRYFGGLDVKQTAETLGVSPATVKNDWRTARAWLLTQLSDRDPSTGPDGKCMRGRNERQA